MGITVHAMQISNKKKKQDYKFPKRELCDTVDHTRGSEEIQYFSKMA